VFLDRAALEQCVVSNDDDALWEQAAIAVDGFRPLNTLRSRLKLVA
jgi:hypothetical protein